MIGSNGIRGSYYLFGVDHNFPTDRFANFMSDVGIPGVDLADIDNALQTRFFQKNPDGTPKERWELDKVQVSCPPEKIREHLAYCGFINETRPISKAYTYAAWPGALVTRAAVRLDDLVSAWNNGVRWEKTIVFGGKRPLQTDKEDYNQCCSAFGVKEEERDSLLSHFREAWETFLNPPTELTMMEWGWFVSTIEGSSDWRNGANATFMDAPMKPPVKEGGQPIRPNTEDTIVEWLKGNPKPGSMLLSSGAPYGMAMDEAFQMLLEPHGFTVETFGHSAPDLPIENLMREVAGTVNHIRRARKL